MINHNKIILSISLTFFGGLVLQGCTSNGEERMVSEQVLSVAPSLTGETPAPIFDLPEIEFDDSFQLSIETDQNLHSFEIRCEELDKDLCAVGTLLTYDCPKSASIYKIVPFDDNQDALYNPIENWQLVWFQSRSLVMGNFQFSQDMTEYEQMTRQERTCFVNSITRQNSKDFSQMNTIKTSYPDSSFCDYVLRYTYPATSTDIYQISSYDMTLNKSITIDTIKERSLDYYVIRRSINGIVIGLPYVVDLHYQDYDDIKKVETRIMSEDCKTYYDTSDIYEVHANDKATEKDVVIYLKDQTIITFEQAINKASPAISNILNESFINSKDTRIYAAELVYLTVQISDMSDVDYYNDKHISRDTYEAYLYPFWVIYVHSDYMCAGEDIADCRPILVDAINGTVILCN